MISFMFYNRMFSKKQIKRNKLIQEQHLKKDDSEVLDKMKQDDKYAYQQAQLLCKMSDTHVYQNTTVQYYDMGEKLFPAMLENLKKAEKFIFMEYFIIVITVVIESHQRRLNPYHG